MSNGSDENYFAFHERQIEPLANRTAGPSPSKKKCLLVAEHLSHYREGVYRLLDDNPQWEFTFVGGPTTRDGSIPEVPAGALKNRITLPNQWIGGRMLWQPGLLCHCSAHRYDAVIFVGSAQFLSTWFAAALMRLRRTKVYFWTIGWHRPDSNPVKRAVRKCFYGLSNQLLLYGSDGYEMAIAAGIKPSRMTVIGNSYSQSGSTSPAPGSDNDGPDLVSLLPGTSMRLVGAVARLTPEKRFDLLLEAINLLRSEGRDVGVVLVGAGPMRERLASLAKELRVPLYLPGAIHDPMVLSEMYERIAVSVLPERAGLTVIQSLSHGVPVVTVDDATLQVPEFRAVHPGRTGELYHRGDVSTLVTAIDKCLLAVNVEGAQVAAACRREVSQNWSVDAHARRILAALNAPSGAAVRRRGRLATKGPN